MESLGYLGNCGGLCANASLGYVFAAFDLAFLIKNINKMSITIGVAISGRVRGVGAR